jgi:hypothetical protein
MSDPYRIDSKTRASMLQTLASILYRCDDEPTTAEEGQALALDAALVANNLPTTSGCYGLLREAFDDLYLHPVSTRARAHMRDAADQTTVMLLATS